MENGQRDYQRAMKEIEELREKIKTLRNELIIEQMERANHWVHAGRMVLWITDPNRKPAVTALTEGPERRVAYAVERGNKGWL